MKHGVFIKLIQFTLLVAAVSACSGSKSPLTGGTSPTTPTTPVADVTYTVTGTGQGKRSGRYRERSGERSGQPECGKVDQDQRLGELFTLRPDVAWFSLSVSAPNNVGT